MTDSLRRLGPAAWLALTLAAPLGCTTAEPERELGRATLAGTASAPPIGERLVSLPRPPILAAEDAAGLSKAGLNAARTDWQRLYRRTDAQLVSIDALPFLTRTAEGRAFLAAEGPRALARGRPAAQCPLTVVGLRPEGAPIDTLVSETLSRCLQGLTAAQPDCGCEVLAVNDFLTVPRWEMNYASGLTARMLVPALGLDALLVADIVEGETLIRGLDGPVGRLERLPGGRVRVVLGEGRQSFEGRSIPVGYRRGRIAERIYATDAEGRRMSLLIGFSPGELAEGVAAWLAWPADS